MSKIRAKRNQGIIVTSRKKTKIERRLQNEYGVQKQKSIRSAQEKIEAMSEQERIAELKRLAAPAIASSNALHAKGAALRAAAFASGNKAKPVPATSEQKEAVGNLPDIEAEFSGTFTSEGGTEPQYSEWMTEDEGWTTPETGWKNAIYRIKDGQRDVPLNCSHKHKTAEAAHSCALKAVKARNSSNRPMTDGWSADARYPWSGERVQALVGDVTGHRGETGEGVAR